MKRTVLSTAAAILLGAAGVAWSATPLVHKGWGGVALFAAIVCAVAGALRIGLAWAPVPEDSFLMPAPARAWLRFLELVRLPPWEEGAVLAIVWLEVLHSSRPWHTAVLGLILTAYLMTVHLAESGAAARTLRPQAPVLAAGACLLALGAGAGMLPAVTPGAGSALLRVLAALAVVAAAGLVLPYVTSGGGENLQRRARSFVQVRLAASTP